FAGGILSARTRSGRNEFSLSLRDTYFDAFDQSGHLYESHAGGRIIRDRLWFFAGGWSGDRDYVRDTHGIALKLSSQLGATSNVVAQYLDSNAGNDGSDAAIVRYTGMFGKFFTAEATGSRTSIESGPFAISENYSTAKLSYVAGNHILTAGGGSYQGDATYFVGDRILWRGLTLDAGVRRETDRNTPRVALTYDLKGNGRHAIAASYGEYANPAFLGFPSVRAASIGYVGALGATGSARVDFIRRDFGDQTLEQMQVEARYRLFENFDAGVTYTRTGGGDFPFFPKNIGHAWFGARFAVGSHEFGVTLLEHYGLPGFRDQWTTDVGLRYGIPFSRFRLTLAADSERLFEDARTFRFWARLRV
ncbi:MAG: hypothetical protein ACLGH0_01325, partial [Thermoanaerobaculia bacterium]